MAKMNADEAMELARLLELGWHDEVVFARSLQQRYGLKAVCVTRAERGAILVTGPTVVDQPGQPIQVVDAVGAGDAFYRGMDCGRPVALAPCLSGGLCQSGRRLGRHPPRGYARAPRRVRATGQRVLLTGFLLFPPANDAAGVGPKAHRPTPSLWPATGSLGILPATANGRQDGP